MTTQLQDPARLAALRALHALDVTADRRFDLMAMVAQQMLDVPMVSLTLVDADRQWRVAWRGPLEQEGSLEGAVCAVAMFSEDLFVVPDLRRDPRFRDSPYVLDEPRLRFYAGFPLRSRSGQPVGSFCVMDRRPRHLLAADREVLTDLGRWVTHELQTGVLGPGDAPARQPGRRR